MTDETDHYRRDGYVALPHHRHGRVDPNPNAWSAHLFLHWVDRNGIYAGEAFDQPALKRARGG